METSCKIWNSYGQNVKNCQVNSLYPEPLITLLRSEGCKVSIVKKINVLHDVILFIELQVQYMKIPSSNLGRTCCTEIVSDIQNNFLLNMFSPCSAKIRTSDKDLPVPNKPNFCCGNYSREESIQGQKLYGEIHYNKRLEKKTIEYNVWILYVEHNWSNCFLKEH